jgi:hypothetical protein
MIIFNVIWHPYDTLAFRFCVGDRFYLCDNRILCEYDYEERMVFANMNSNIASNGSMQNLKQQRQTVSVSFSCLI